MKYLWLPFASSVALLSAGISQAGITPFEGAFGSIDGFWLFDALDQNESLELGEILMIHLGPKAGTKQERRQPMMISAGAFANNPVSTALSRCDGSQLRVDVGYQVMQVTCSQVLSRDVMLPEPALTSRDVVSHNRTAEMYVSDGQQGRNRFVLDRKLVEKAINVVLSMTGEKPLPLPLNNHQVRKQWYTFNDRAEPVLHVVLEAVNEKPLAPPTTEGDINLAKLVSGILMAVDKVEDKQEKGDGGESKDKSASKNQGDKPPPAKGNPSPGGTGNKNKRDDKEDRDGDKGKPKAAASPTVVLTMGVPLNLQQLLQALEILILHADDEQLQAIEDAIKKLQQLLAKVNQGVEEVDASDEEVMPEGLTSRQQRIWTRRHQAVMASRQLAELLPAVVNAYQDDIVFLQPVLVNAFTHLMSEYSLHQPARECLAMYRQRQRELVAQQQQLPSLPLPPHQDEEEGQGAVGGVGVTEPDGQTLAQVPQVLLVVLINLFTISVNVASEPPTEEEQDDE